MAMSIQLAEAYVSLTAKGGNALADELGKMKDKTEQLLKVIGPSGMAAGARMFAEQAKQLEAAKASIAKAMDPHGGLKKIGGGALAAIGAMGGGPGSAAATGLGMMHPGLAAAGGAIQALGAMGAKVNPALFEKLEYVWNDLQGTIGIMVVPVVRALTPVIRMFADTLLQITRPLSRLIEMFATQLSTGLQSVLHGLDPVITGLSEFIKVLVAVGNAIPKLPGMKDKDSGIVTKAIGAAAQDYADVMSNPLSVFGKMKKTLQMGGIMGPDKKKESSEGLGNNNQVGFKDIAGAKQQFMVEALKASAGAQSIPEQQLREQQLTNQILTAGASAAARTAPQPGRTGG